MKELEQKTKINEEILVIKPIKKSLNLLGTIKPYKGHKCYEYNFVTNEICEAVFFETTVNMFSKNKTVRKLLKKENCLYVTALNKDNAIKKINKIS